VSILDDGLNKIPIDRYASRWNRKDRHHVFPRKLLADLAVPPNLYNSICNMCLLTAEENQSIGARRPSLYVGHVRDTGKYFKPKMQRHVLPFHEDAGLWAQDVRQGFMRFLKQRTELICRALEEEAGMRLFRRDL
jgi:hypothetical protein